jgi:CRP/FNR family transcriptional regulator, cyclic AMP receptor protein
VARHLLDLASERAPELVAPVNQQLLAEAVGTVREVTVRVLRELRAAGVVRTERNRIIIVDPARLIAEQDWNSSP